jgi:zinc transport system ATP-binding protein
VILEPLSLSIFPHSITTILGPNGGGKTTLLRLLLGLLRPTAGSIVKAHSLRVGYVPQAMTVSPLLPMEAKDVLMMVGASQQSIEAEVDFWDLKHRLRTPLRFLSGGERQRLMVARACLQRPNLLILDEPTQGLDIQGQARFYERLLTLQKKRAMAVLLVSHDLHLVMRATDYVWCLNGHICCHGSPTHIQQHPEFQALWGEKPWHEWLGIYTHRHDHTHDEDHDPGSCPGHTSA